MGLFFYKQSISWSRESACTDISRQKSMVEQMVMTTSRNNTICFSFFINIITTQHYPNPLQISRISPHHISPPKAILIKILSCIVMSDSESYSSDQDYGWINWFCNLEDHAFFCKVDEEYIRDSFNLYGLKQMFEHYNEALDMILSSDAPEEEELEDQRYLTIYQEATDIYGLIHARFIVTPKGLAVMRDKYQKGVFGVCPRVLCQRQHLLPIGMSEELRTSRVKVYCPRCQEVYIPKKKYPDVDGAYFGCSFPNILLMVYGDLMPQSKQIQFVPRVYGFKIYGKPGSHYQKKQARKELTHYTFQEIKKMKTRNELKAERLIKDDF